MLRLNMGPECDSPRLSQDNDIFRQRQILFVAMVGTFMIEINMAFGEHYHLDENEF